MNSKECFKLVNENPAFYLATAEGDQPRVRGMLLFRADENGFIFHTSSSKDVFAQIKENPKAEMCFSCNGTQIRVTGVLEQVHDEKLRAEIFAHPTRKFLQAWVDNGIDHLLQIFVMKKCTAVTWTMESNFAPKEIITLCE
ncbi:MAG: pyridoxamine 5'-phosphate oxidase family protein [Oscillospiraceae bacterium]|nr:pyridoxamine 5'-phosphate oxidase family protein [Oscillospiraceae bacterium]